MALEPSFCWLLLGVRFGFSFVISTSNVHRRRMPSRPEIGGWLAFMAFDCAWGFSGMSWERWKRFSLTCRGFRNPNGHLQLIAVRLLTVAYLIVKSAGHRCVVCFQKRRATRRLFLVFLVLTALVPLSLLLMLMTVPGVRLEKIYSAEDTGWNVARVALVGLWYWYLCVSVRVKRTH